MTKKIVIDKNGMVTSAEDTATSPDVSHRCPICSEPLDADKRHECNPITVGKTVFDHSKNAPTLKTDNSKEQVGFDISCPICKSEHGLQSLYDHIMVEHSKQSYRILYAIQISCPFCRDTLSVSQLATHLAACKHKPSKGLIGLQLRSTFSNRVNILVHWIKITST